MNFTISTPNRVIEIDSTGDAVLTFEAVGFITSGDIHFTVSTDGVNFSPASFFSFVSGTMQPNVSTATGFSGEDRGSVDVLGKVKTRITSTADFQGKINLNVCEVADAPVPTPGDCCPQPTVFKTLAVSREGSTPVWTPNPSASFVLMGYMIGVTGEVSGTSSPLTVRLLDGVNELGQNHYISIPS